MPGCPTLVVIFAGWVGQASAQQCLGRPTEAGEQSMAVRLDLDEFTILSGEYSRAARAVAWSVAVGAAADELIPRETFAFALGGGGSWTRLHRVICPAFSFWTWADQDIRRTRVKVGAGVGRRLGEERIRGAAFLFPHVRIVRASSRWSGRMRMRRN